MKKNVCLLCAMLITCIMMGFATAELPDMTFFRENADGYIVTDVDDRVFITSTVNPYTSFSLPAWGDESSAAAFFALFVYEEEGISYADPMLLINVYTPQHHDIRSLTIRADGRDYTFSLRDEPSYSGSPYGECQLIQVYLGYENIAFLEAMTAKGTSAADPGELMIPIDIVFHGDEDCAAVMSLHTMTDYMVVIFRGFCEELNGMVQYIARHPGTPMTVTDPGVETGLTAGTVPEEDPADAEEQLLTLQDLVGVWEFEGTYYHGQKIMTGMELTDRNGRNVITEFTSDGLMILDGADHAEVYEVGLSGGYLSTNGSRQAVRLEDGRLVMDVTEQPGVTMVYVRSDLPGREATANVEESLLGDWAFEQVAFPADGMSINADEFRMIYGMPAPTLQVRKAGLVMMSLGDDTVIFAWEEWQSEDGKLVHTETFDDGTVMIWTFVQIAHRS